jgi:hypothetical protein
MLKRKAVEASMRRRLTDEEKRRVCDTQRAVESARFPGYFIDIIVSDETDDNGDPIWSALKSREYEEMQIGCKFG